MSNQREQPVQNIPLGIGWMLLTIFWFVTLDALAKYLLGHYPTTQVIWGRFVFHCVIVYAVMRWWRVGRVRSANLPLQTLRSLMMFLTNACFFIGISTTPLAVASTIMFLSPIFVTILAIPLLGEQVGPRRWASIGVAFVGALVVVRPGVGGIDIGMLLLLTAAVSNALYQILTRKVTLYDDHMTSLFHTGVVGTVVMTFIAPSYFEVPRDFDALLFIALGAIGAIGHLCIIRAFATAPASIVAPFSYSALVWAAIYGYLLFEEVLDIWTITGASLIIASGVYIFRREKALAEARITGSG